MKKKIIKWVLLIVILSLTSTMCYLIYTSKTNLEKAKEELILLEKGEITRDEAIHIPEDMPSLNPNTLHPEGAFLWLIPFGIVIFVLVVLYVVVFLT